MSRNDMVEIEGTFLRETKLAVQVDDGRIKPWLAKVHVAEDFWTDVEEGTDVTFEIPEWLAEQEGLI